MTKRSMYSGDKEVGTTREHAAVPERPLQHRCTDSMPAEGSLRMLYHALVVC